MGSPGGHPCSRLMEPRMPSIRLCHINTHMTSRSVSTCRVSSPEPPRGLDHPATWHFPPSLGDSSAMPATQEITSPEGWAMSGCAQTLRCTDVARQKRAWPCVWVTLVAGTPRDPSGCCLSRLSAGCEAENTYQGAG